MLSSLKIFPIHWSSVESEHLDKQSANVKHCWWAQCWPCPLCLPFQDVCLFKVYAQPFTEHTGQFHTSGTRLLISLPQVLTLSIASPCTSAWAHASCLNLQINQDIFQWRAAKEPLQTPMTRQYHRLANTDRDNNKDSEGAEEMNRTHRCWWECKLG